MLTYPDSGMSKADSLHRVFTMTVCLQYSVLYILYDI